MTQQPKDGAPGTTDQSPRWEGPEENRPRGYLPAIDDPNVARDAAGENLADPDKRDLSDALDTGDSREARIRQRAREIWEREGKPDGHHERHWAEAVWEIEDEDAVNVKRPPA
jgi:hypothetical protein